MAIVSQVHPFVVGVDTHARSHALCILAALTGRVLGQAEFPATAAGLRRAIAWVAKRTGADLATLWVIEGAASFGAMLAGAVTDSGYQAVEAARMDKRAHAAAGKSDLLDAHRIGAAVLALPVQRLRQLRRPDGARAALSVLLAARDQMTRNRTAAVNALTALLRTHDLGLDARGPLSKNTIRTIAGWRARQGEELALGYARREATRLAKQAIEVDLDLAQNNTEITHLVASSQAAVLLEITGFGPVNAAHCYVAWSHHGRLRSEAAFAALAGTSPLSASSGNTSRHRLNRYGDRRLNSALHSAVLTRRRWDPETASYCERRTAEGRTTKEINRCLKRYLARKIYRTLNATQQTETTA
jgi:transposase